MYIHSSLALKGRPKVLKQETLGVLISVPLMLAATGETFAWEKQFSGTRDQVRKACAQVGGVINEGGNYTSCYNPNKGTGVSCGDDGKCGGGGPGPMPRIGMGSFQIVTSLLEPRLRVPATVPQSLVEGGVPSAAPPEPQKDGEIIN